jgi:hypothetical protein
MNAAGRIGNGVFPIVDARRVRHPGVMADRTALSIQKLVPGFEPESDLERALVAEPELREGLAWGRPRFGHPEACVGLHVAAILGRIGDYPSELRADLRFMSLVHDSFKRAVRPAEPWSRDNDHAVLARRFAERFTDDERVLCAIELHDELFWIWHNGGNDVEQVLERVPDVELYFRFVELDSTTEGKDPSLLWWIRHAIARTGRWIPPPLVPEERPEDVTDVVYVETFATEPGEQEAVALAAGEVARGGESALDARAEVLRSEDGLRVLIVWRWSGPAAPRLIREGGLVRQALQKHAPLLRAEAKEAHVFRPA